MNIIAQGLIGCANTMIHVDYASSIHPVERAGIADMHIMVLIFLLAFVLFSFGLCMFIWYLEKKKKLEKEAGLRKKKRMPGTDVAG